MDALSHHPGATRQATTTRDDDADSIDSTRARTLWASKNPSQAVSYAPKERFRLGYFDVICLVLNRTIGSGIFNSPHRVMLHTRSTGASLLLWFVGMIHCMSGLHVYLEYGLNIPRYTIKHGTEESVPRSGGDLNYLQYVYRKPAYRKGTVLLSTCIFGIAFIALGNMAGNSISFAMRAMAAAGIDNPSNNAVRGIAVATAILTCFIHAVSRRFGIWLNNFLAVIKVAILLLIIVTAIVVGAGGLKTQNVLSDNTKIDHAFADRSTNLNDYSHAFLAIVFSFSGFEQPNYVLGEISRPRRKFPVSSIVGVSTVVLLYMAVNISYMVVVPKEDQISGGVAEHFFSLTLGSLGTEASQQTGKRIFNAFLAVSSIGNVIVMTYTAARVKQEIAKEGILPYPTFFAQSTDISIGRLMKWLQDKQWFPWLFRSKWFAPDSHREKTPVGALVLHCASCLILILATWRLDPLDAYTALTSMSSYVINATIGSFVGFGILILRFKGPPETPVSHKEKSLQDQPTVKPSWQRMTGKHFNPFLSVLCATLYTTGNIWLVVTQWVPKREDPSSDGGGDSTTDFSYSYVIPTVGWSVIGGGIAWFLAFLAVAKYKRYKYHEVYVVEKQPVFESASSGTTGDESAARGSSGFVMVHETVYLSWVGKETLRQRRPHFNTVKEGGAGESPSPAADPYAGTDFSGYFQGQQQHGMEMGNVHSSPQVPQSTWGGDVANVSQGRGWQPPHGPDDFGGVTRSQQAPHSTVEYDDFGRVIGGVNRSQQAPQHTVEYDDFGRVIGGPPHHAS